MSEVKTNEPAKQEGDFSLKGKFKKPKQLDNAQSKIAKVVIKDQKPEITKVVIPKEQTKPQEDAVQKQEAESPVLLEKQPEVELQAVGQGDDKPAEDGAAEFTPLQEVTEEEITKVTKEAQEAVRDEKVLGRKLPENVEKLVSFMEETGGTVEDYVWLNADYSTVNEKELVKEFYKKTKPYLDVEDMNMILEDYEYDEDIDEDRDIRKKKIAFKEEVAKARNFLEETKSKYYDEIKLRPGATQDQQKATEFFNRYQKDQDKAEKQHDLFKSKTKQFFNDEFKGFDFNVGEKKFRYGLQNKEAISDSQSNINNFVGKFLDKEGNVEDTEGYHKAIYTAMNADKMANHFYEQGKADAVRDVMSKSKNISNEPRKVSEANGFLKGFKVKSISGYDSSKLSIKTKKIN